MSVRYYFLSFLFRYYTLTSFGKINKTLSYLKISKTEYSNRNKKCKNKEPQTR